MFDAKALLNALLGSQRAASVTAAASSLSSQGEQSLGNVAALLTEAVDRLQHVDAMQAGALLGRAAQAMSDNGTASGTVAAGLAALLLRTSTGRAALDGAAKVGGLTALGALAHRAFSNHHEGKPPLSGVPVLAQSTTPPAGCGFHEDDHCHDSVVTMIRAAIATAAADGVVDPAQRATILDEMRTAGLDPECAKFLDFEIAHPATAADIAAAVGDAPQLAVQTYAAARLVASPASAPEVSFLAALARALKLDPALVAQVDAAVAHA
jgi:uncharacterized membrane protein YebE (DUF533 family)